MRKLTAYELGVLIREKIERLSHQRSLAIWDMDIYFIEKTVKESLQYIDEYKKQLAEECQDDE